MNTKNIEVVITPREPHFVGDGFRVHNFIPSFANLSMRRMDPFIMMDYNSKFNFPATDVPKGVGKQVMENILDWVRKENVKIIPLCPFAKAQFDKNEEFRDVLS